MKDFVVKPPCKRPLLAEVQRADPSSVRRSEEFPKEWAKRQSKLAKQANIAVKEFNRATKASNKAGASGSGSASAPKKAMQKKPANNPKPTVAQPAASKASAPKISKSSVPPPASSSSMAAARASTPVVLASCQCTKGFAKASVTASSASASGKPSSSTPKLKQKVTAGRETRPSLKSKAVVPQVDEHGLADEDELAEFLRRKQKQATIAKNSSDPMLLDPKKLLDFIDIWCTKLDTPLDDLNLPPRPSHMISSFILNEKHKIAQAKLVKKQQIQKEKELKSERATVVTEEPARATASVVPEVIEPSSSLAATPPNPSSLNIITLPSTSEVKKEKSAEIEERKRKASTPPIAPEIVKKLKMATLSSIVIPIDAIHISSTPLAPVNPDRQIVPYGVDYQIPWADEDDEENHSAATTEQVDEEIKVEEDSSLHQVSSRNPSQVPLTEEHDATSSGSSEATKEEVDIDGATMLVLHDEFWEAAHPSSPVTTPLTLEPQSPARTEEIHTGSEGKQPSQQSIPEEIPAVAANENALDEPMVDVISTSPSRVDSIPSVDTDIVPTATTDEVARTLAVIDPNDSTGSPRPVFDVRQKKHNLQPVPVMPKIGRVLRRPQFDNAKFFEEKNFFIGYCSTSFKVVYFTCTAGHD
nr:bromo and FHA domain-containing protein DDB_G0267958-like [Aegilops tauschii subsp. strangulata]